MNASAGAPRLVTTGGRSKMLEDPAAQSGSFADTAFVIPFAALSTGAAGGGLSDASSTPALVAISATTKNSTMVLISENRAGAGALLSLSDDARAGIWLKASERPRTASRCRNPAVPRPVAAPR